MRVWTACLLIGCALSASCRKDTSPALPTHNGAESVADNMVALPGGATMMAQKGTVGRDVVDWVNESGSATRRFELGGQSFIGKSTEPTPEAMARLTRFVTMLKAHPEVKVKLIGYTDSTGDPADNRRISEQRARNVLEELTKAGVSGRRITTEGRGDAEPIDDNGTELGRAHNQRVAVILTKKA